MKSPSGRLVAVLLLMTLILVGTLLSGCQEFSTGEQSDLRYRPSEADLAFEAGADHPPTLKTLYTTANILATQGRDAEAEIVLVRILREYPDFTPTYNNLAEVKMRQRHIDEAISILTEGLEVNPADPVLLNNLGMCWMIRREYGKALEMFTTAAGVRPESTRYRANMAVALGFLGRDTEALALYRQILSEEQAIYNLEVIRRARSGESDKTTAPKQELTRP